MITEYPRSRLGLALAGLFAGAACATALAAPVPDTVAPVTTTPSTCDERDACIKAIMAAARAGHDIELFSLVTRLKRLSGAMPGGFGTYGARLRTQRELAESHLQARRLQEGELELRKLIATFPTHSPSWADLATVLGMQDKTEDAVAALVLAHFWAGKPDEVLRSYRRVVDRLGSRAAGAAYQSALDLIKANAQAADGLDAALPPWTPGSPMGSGTAKPTPPQIEFRKCAPNYPEVSAENAQMGTVELAFYVDASGRVQRVKRIGSSGHVDLDNATIAALGPCSFRPAMADGKPVAAWTKIQYVWKLE